MPRPLRDAVVVITGASSGIGRAAALRIARRGSSLALCARAEEPLAEVAGECEAAGAAAILWEALDVADEAAVERLAAGTTERFGRIDVWVNNAATMAYGNFAEIPSEVFRAVIETNLMGQVHGARAALRRFRRQEAGVLINLSSVWGRVSTPQVSPYVVSKNGVRALSECLHSELADLPEVHVATMLPQAVDTPIFEHAGNYSGHRVRPVPPTLSVDEVAAGIEACAENPKREVTYGRAGRGLELLYALSPVLYRRIAHRAFLRGTMSPLAAGHSPGNALASTAPHRTEGGWGRRRGILRRAFAAAAAGALSGLFGARPSVPAPRGAGDGDGDRRGGPP